MSDRSDRMVEVKGRCPACLLHTLFVGDGGYLTCSNVDCNWRTPWGGSRKLSGSWPS